MRNRPLAYVVRERAELQTGTTARLADELLSLARGAEDLRSRREAYERLAMLDAETRHDPASALLWHRTILEEYPAYLPSLRHVEQHLLRAGRTDELEPIVSATARALRGSGAGEGTAHAELAFAVAKPQFGLGWDVSHEQEMVEIAVLSRPGIAVRTSHRLPVGARAVQPCRGSVDGLAPSRYDKPIWPESASILVRAADAALRLGDFKQSRALLERASLEDPGDVMMWGLLACARRRGGDAAGTAEALEACARTSVVAEHRATAWHQAGRVWRDEVRDPARAILALENAQAIDIAQDQVFDDLAQLYESRGMTAPRLRRSSSAAWHRCHRPRDSLRIGAATRPTPRRTRGCASGARRVPGCARRAPGRYRALSAFADVCVELKDWSAAEPGLSSSLGFSPDRTTRGARMPSSARFIRVTSSIWPARKWPSKRCCAGIPTDTVTSERLIEIVQAPRRRSTRGRPCPGAPRRARRPKRSGGRGCWSSPRSMKRRIGRPLEAVAPTPGRDVGRR